MHPPAGPLAGLAEALEERRFRLLGSEDVRPVIAPVQYMIHPVFGFQSQRSRHGPKSTDSPATVNPNPQGLTPFLPRDPVFWPALTAVMRKLIVLLNHLLKYPQFKLA